MSELDAISKSLGAATGVTPPERNMVVDDVKDITKTLREKQQKNFEDDYDGARNNMKELIDESLSLLPEVVTLTREAQSATMYTAASMFIKMIAELNKDLLGISATKDAARAPASQPTALDPSKPTEGNTTVYIGTSEEVFRQFSKRKGQQVQDADFVLVSDTSVPPQESSK